MVQHRTDSSTDNVTPSVQSWFYKPGISRRALPPAHCGLQRTSHCIIMCADCCQRSCHKNHFEPLSEKGELQCAISVRVPGDTIAPQWKFNQEMDRSEQQPLSCPAPAGLLIDQLIKRGALNTSSVFEGAPGEKIINFTFTNLISQCEKNNGQNQSDTDEFNRVMEESEVCSLPGGLASVRKQFETQETATSHSVTQFHFHHRTVQEMSNSEVTVSSSSSRQVVPGSQQLNFNQETMVSYSGNNLASSFENHQNETEEEFPRYTTKELRDRFEKTIEEAAPQKPMKVRVPKSELCAVCRRRAYPMDALIVDKKKYHKSCFYCEHCRNKLSLGNYVSLHGHFYCLHHYKQLLKSKGSYDNGLGQKPAGSGGPIPSDEKLEWRYSMSSISSVDKMHGGESETTKTCNEIKPHCNKISVVWPPQADPPKKAFKIEEDIQLTKPQWPPPDNSPKSPKQQHRKAVPRSVL